MGHPLVLLAGEIEGNSELPTSGAPMLPAVGASWYSGRGLALANCHRPAANLGQKVGHLMDVGYVRIQQAFPNRSGKAAPRFRPPAVAFKARPGDIWASILMFSIIKKLR
jgi:hypothetical protein